MQKSENEYWAEGCWIRIREGAAKGIVRDVAFCHSALRANDLVRMLNEHRVLSAARDAAERPSQIQP